MRVGGRTELTTTATAAADLKRSKDEGIVSYSSVSGTRLRLVARQCIGRKVLQPMSFARASAYVT
eukprot:m.220219 g.220219  ORF g.220219 m.220219 type:complete len:65 (-) comp25776_c0_seq7:1650-1844(-)